MSSWQPIIVGTNMSKEWSGLHLTTIKRKVTLHLGAFKYILQHDGRPDGLYGEWVKMWNLGSLSENIDAYEELRKRMIDICCLQKVRWRGQC